MTLTRSTDSGTMSMCTSPVQVMTAPRVFCPRPIPYPTTMVATASHQHPATAVTTQVPVFLTTTPRCHLIAPGVQQGSGPALTTFAPAARGFASSNARQSTPVPIMATRASYVVVNMVPVAHSPLPGAILAPSVQGASPCSTPASRILSASGDFSEAMSDADEEGAHHQHPQHYHQQQREEHQHQHQQHVNDSDSSVDVTKFCDECTGSSCDGFAESTTESCRRFSDPNPLRYSGQTFTTATPPRRVRGSSVSSLSSPARKEQRGKRSKRGPYQHFSYEQRLEIAEYAAVHGSTAASRHFTELYHRAVKRSTIDSMLAKVRGRKSESSMADYSSC
eukprot:scpid61044/ scgid26653/ 